MVELYATLVREGRRTIDQVPARYRAEVQALLDA
ncbi:CD1375 family protein [Desulfofalx alkaliphila]|nr:CD1375 family protein [Desulfofalx alkaliphila]